MSLTVQQQKAAKITFAIALVLAVLAFVYFKVIKPGIDKKREEQRIKETNVLTSAQAPEPTVVPSVVNTSPTSTGTPSVALVGIGGNPVTITEEQKDDVPFVVPPTTDPITESTGTGARV